MSPFGSEAVKTWSFTGVCSFWGKECEPNFIVILLFFYLSMTSRNDLFPETAFVI